MVAFICFLYLCTFAARKNHFAAVLLYVVCARTLYIGKRLKAYYLPFAVCLQPFYFPFSFSIAFCFTKFVCETLCKFLYFYASLKCIFMQSIMVNRKLFGIFEFSQHLCANVLSFYFLFLCFFSYFG